MPIQPSSGDIESIVAAVASDFEHKDFVAIFKTGVDRSFGEPIYWARIVAINCSAKHGGCFVRFHQVSERGFVGCGVGNMAGCGVQIEHAIDQHDKFAQLGSRFILKLDMYQIGFHGLLACLLMSVRILILARGPFSGESRYENG
jgi:hypothetical protein